MLLDQTLDKFFPANFWTLTHAEILEKCTDLISYYLKILCHRCDSRLFLPAQRSLMVFRSLGQHHMNHIDDFRHALIFTDETLGDEWGGFSNLFESAVMAGEIDLETEEIHVDTKQLALTIEKLTILHDIADSFSVNSDTAAGCIILEDLYEVLKNWCSHQPELTKKWQDVLDNWVLQSTCTPALRDLWSLRDFIKEVSPQVLYQLGEIDQARAFCLWFLSHHLAEQKSIEGFTHRLLDTLLARAQLAPLSVFESAGLFP
jgi:hypothetical protein